MAVLLKLLTACAFLGHEAVVAQVSPGRTASCNAAEPDGTLKTKFTEAQSLLTDAGKVIIDNNLGGLTSVHHVILVQPASVPFGPGAGPSSEMIAQAYARLEMKEALATKLEKVVLVGYKEEGHNCEVAGSAGGVVLGAKVCGFSGLVDAKAEAWLREHGPQKLQQTCPTFLGPTCPGANPSITSHLPFLSALWERESTNRQLTGNIIPLMIFPPREGSASAKLGKMAQLGPAVADFLQLLVGPGGPWAEQKVLFVFSADFSHGIKKRLAGAADGETAAALKASAFSAFADKVTGWKGSAAEADKLKVPDGFAGLLAASKLAGELGMQGKILKVGNSGEFEGNTQTNAEEPVRGFATMGFVQPKSGFLIQKRRRGLNLRRSGNRTLG